METLVVPLTVVVFKHYCFQSRTYQMSWKKQLSRQFRLLYIYNVCLLQIAIERIILLISYTIILALTIYFTKHNMVLLKAALPLPTSWNLLMIGHFAHKTNSKLSWRSIHRFLLRDAMYKRSLCRHAVSVCLSVCLSRSWVVSKRINIS